LGNECEKGKLKNVMGWGWKFPYYRKKIKIQIYFQKPVDI
jgi:hypothetical protein